MMDLRGHLLVLWPLVRLSTEPVFSVSFYEDDMLAFSSKISYYSLQIRVLPLAPDRGTPFSCVRGNQTVSHVLYRSSRHKHAIHLRVRPNQTGPLVSIVNHIICIPFKPSETVRFMPTLSRLSCYQVSTAKLHIYLLLLLNHLGRD
jgi:hypothetical protein